MMYTMLFCKPITQRYITLINTPRSRLCGWDGDHSIIPSFFFWSTQFIFSTF